MLISILAIVFMIVGLLLYMSTPPKWSEVGRILFFSGSLALALLAGSSTVKIF